MGTSAPAASNGWLLMIILNAGHGTAPITLNQQVVPTTVCSIQRAMLFHQVVLCTTSATATPIALVSPRCESLRKIFKNRIEQFSVFHRPEGLCYFIVNLCISIKSCAYCIFNKFK